MTLEENISAAFNAIDIEYYKLEDFLIDKGIIPDDTFNDFANKKANLLCLAPLSSTNINDYKNNINDFKTAFNLLKLNSLFQEHKHPIVHTFFSTISIIISKIQLFFNLITQADYDRKCVFFAKSDSKKGFDKIDEHISNLDTYTLNFS